MNPIFGLSVLTIGATLALVTVGGAVHATGSSLACPDWPLCHGELMPAMVGGVGIEHGHRLLGALVVALVVALAIVARRVRRPELGLVRLTTLGVALVGVQAVLGGATVLLGLSSIASTLHLMNATALLVLLTVVADRAWYGAMVPRDEASRSNALPALVALGAVLVQIFTGGVVRHTGARFSCAGSVLTCRGMLWPDTPIERMHMLHRFGAIAVAVTVLAACSWTLLRARDPLARTLALAGASLLGLQVALGSLAVTDGLPVTAATAHLLVAALLAVDLMLLRLCLGRRHPEPADGERIEHAWPSIETR